MSRSRIIFFLIIGAAIIVVVVALLVQNIQTSNQIATQTAVAQATMTAVVAQATMTAVSVPGNTNTGSSVVPVFAGGTTPTDSLPKYVCAADAFGSYYTLQQMQVAGYDVQYGFHLGLVPFLLDGPGGSYDISEEARDSLLENGNIDCLFTTLDAAALSGAGIITAVVDESAGADQLWARSTVKTLNDLRGKKVIYASNSVGQFFALYGLFVAGMNPRTDVTMIPADGQADAVSGWEPDILNAAKGGGAKLIGSDKLRVIVDVIMTARQSIQSRPRVVQAFHDAWFRTLKAQFDNFAQAAQQIAAWGHNDWSGINLKTAEADLGKALDHIAQAGLTQNSAVMSDTSVLVERLDQAQRVWAAFGQSAYTGRTSDLIDPTFVRQSATRNDLTTSGSPRNASFLLTSRPNLKAIAPNEGETLAVLPCRKLNFIPNSTELTSDARRILDSCVLPVLHSSIGLYLKIVGSAAWLPGDTEQINRDFAMKRAQAVQQYLVSKGIDPNRLTLDTVLPPPERRGSSEGSVQEQDRFVEMSLITVGR